MNLQSFFNLIKPVVVTALGAVLSGAALAAQQHISSGGSVTDYKSLGYAAAFGGISALGALYVKPPISTPSAPVITPIPPAPPSPVLPVTPPKP